MGTADYLWRLLAVGEKTGKAKQYDKTRSDTCPNTGGEDTGPGTPGQDCVKIPDSAGKADDVMKCCQDTANKGPWLPVLNDCHQAVKDCLKDNGLENPKMPRIGKRR
jgi:hypothetical protein